MGSLDSKRTTFRNNTNKPNSKGKRLNWGRLSEASFNVVNEKGKLVFSNSSVTTSKLLVP